jgi:hypothetical protein
MVESGGLLEELIVASEVVRLDGDFIGGAIAGDDRLGRFAKAAREALLVDERANVQGARTSGSR